MNPRSGTISRRGFLGGSLLATVGGLSPRLLEAADTKPTGPVSLSNLKLLGAPDEAYWSKVRTQFNLLDRMIFMNNGTLGPAPQVVLDTRARVEREVAEDPTNGYREEDREAVRAEVAKFVGATADEIALPRSTSEGMNLFAHGLDWRPGDEVLMCRHEHGGGIGPYRTLGERAGVQIQWIDIPSPPESVDQIVGLYEKAVTSRTRVILVSHITYVTGLVMPIRELSELARRKGLLLSVDGAHPVGMMEVNFTELGCDHYAAAGQKWLLAGTGTGICYVKKDVQDRIWPLMGWVDRKAEKPNERGARKYELTGQKHVPSVLGMAAALELQNTIGKAHIEARGRALGGRLRAGLKEIPGVKLWTSTDPRLSAALSSFSIGEVPMENVQRALMEQYGVYIRTMTTGNLNACRVSTHLYNMPDEVDRLLEGVRYIARHSQNYMAKPTAAAVDDEEGGLRWRA